MNCQIKVASAVVLVCEKSKNLFSFYFFIRYAHLLPDNEFPLLKIQEPTRVNGKYYFAQTRLKIGASDKKCMMCGKLLPTGPVISSHDPKRNTVVSPQNIK